jgi:hypothetical protein
MVTITARALPDDSLLAGFAAASCYTDCFTADLPRAVSLSDLITAFYNSPAFRPERWVLHAIGKGSGAADVQQLAAAQTNSFAAWNLVERTDTQILLEDFQKSTCSWLAIEPLAATAPTIQPRTRIYFGSGVKAPDGLLVKTLMPLHRWYAKTLLRSAAGSL